MPIYLGTVALETNRWAAGRIPTFCVSDYLQRVAQDGFDGLELWENHFMLADEAEREKLCAAGNVAIFNSYAVFENGMTDALHQTAAAINRVRPGAIKFNLGSRNDVAGQVKTLMAFADLLTPGVRLLCECHSGTCMDTAEEAAAVFACLDDRFGAIIHLKESREFLRQRFDAYGDRICHIHMANWVGGDCEPMCREPGLLENIRYMVSRGFLGTYTLEFTAGLKLGLPALYENAAEDLKWLRRNGIQ